MASLITPAHFRLPLRPAALLAVVLACSPVLAQQQTVYQWKDAKGVTHYADSAPAQTYKKRDINARSGTATEAVAVKKGTVDVACDNARKNLVSLRGQGPVGLDKDGDGKPDGNLTANQRAAQIELNEALLKANCDAPAATTGN